MRTAGATRDCNGCRFWSEVVAQAVGGRPVEALCLSRTGPRAGKYTAGADACEAWKPGHHGPVDEPGFEQINTELYQLEEELGL